MYKGYRIAFIKSPTLTKEEFQAFDNFVLYSFSKLNYEGRYFVNCISLTKMKV